MKKKNPIASNYESYEPYGSVSLKTLKNAIKQVEDNAKKNNMTAKEIEEIPITFDYLIGSFFPEIVKNVHNEANKQYTKGYIEGRKSMEEKLNGTTRNDR